MNKKKFFPDDFPDCECYLWNRNPSSTHGFKVRTTELYVFGVEDRLFFEIRHNDKIIAIVQASEYIIDFVSAGQIPLV